MTAPSANASPAPPRSHRRVVAAGFLGTTIEYYDFFIYGTAAALVFPTVFFPALGAAAATAASFATFAVAFIARPVGGVVFGHIGDRTGRKATLVATMMIMGMATVLIGSAALERPDRCGRTHRVDRAAVPPGVRRRG